MVRTERPLEQRTNEQRTNEQRTNEQRTNNERRHPNERQPVLPFNAAYLAMNRRDQERETHNPMQLELLPPVQPDLFIDTPLPEVDTNNAAAATGTPRRT